MNKNEIITDLYNRGTIKKFLNRYLEKEENLKDLEQDIYILLIKLPTDLLTEMYLSGKLEHWLAATIKNQIYSKTSYYYKTYKEFKDKSKEITNNEEF